jgi:OOP family OmpA-OmpF porin
MKLRIALLSASILAAPFVVRAQPIDGLYVGAGAGANLLQTEAIHNAPIQGSNPRFDVGPVVVASVGYGLGNGLRFELQGSYYDNSIRGLKTGGAFGSTSAKGDEYKEGVFGNVLYDIPLDQFGINSPVFPYVGVGVGYVHNQFSNERISGPGFFARSTGQNDNFGAQAIAGLSFPIYDLVPGLAFTAEYRFLGEPGGRSYGGQIFTNAGTSSFKQSFASDDFNHSILVGIRYAFNTVQPVPPPPPVAAVPAPAPARTYLVFFDWDRADLTDRARQIIAEAAQASTHVQFTRIEVQGNADRSGTPAYNQKLSLRRAQTVAAELVRLGVARTAIDIQAFGDTRPLVPTAPGVREPQNRRVAIILR